MLRNASAIKGSAIAASDGGLVGIAGDILFDDTTWVIRWLVVDTGNWLSGRKVLLPPSAFGHFDPERRELSVKLTKQEVFDGPAVNMAQPVSRQMEGDIYDHHGWRPYWSIGLYKCGFGPLGNGPVGLKSPAPGWVEETHVAAPVSDEDPHLRSIEETISYHIHAIDGEIGHLEDFLIEEADWTVRFLIVDTKNWWPARKALIAPHMVRAIDWQDRFVNLDVDRQTVKGSPTYDAAAPVDRAYVQRFHAYYGKVPPSTSDQR